MTKDLHQTMEGLNHISSLTVLSVVFSTLFVSPMAQIIAPEKSCITKIDETCGAQIGASIFQNTGNVTKQCCSALVGLGRECHDSWVNAVLIYGNYSQNATEILRKSSKVWAACAPGAESATPPCKTMKDAVCGREIVKSVFHDIGLVIEPCCEALVGIGRECHNALVNARITSGGYENNATWVLKKSLQLWNACASTAKGNCQRMKDGVCGEQIVKNVFHGIGQVSETCCGALMNFGKGCHETLVNARITSGGYEKNATEVLKRSNDTWSSCASITKTRATFGCERMRDGVCGKQIVMSVFHSKYRVSPNCCKELVERGKECHDTLVNRRITSGGFENNATTVLRNSLEIWNGCSTTAKISSSICKKMKDDVCGEQIVMSIFDNNGQVTEKCCEGLREMGKECNDALVDDLLIAKGLRNNSTEILKRSSEVWARCASIL